MKKNLLFYFFLLCFTTISTAQMEEVKVSYKVLQNANIIDGIGEEVRKGSILIKGQIIEAIEYEAAIQAPKGAIIYDLTDQFIIPGLIDGHVHLGTDPSQSDNLEITKTRLAYYLNCGITTVRDMAGDTRFLSFLSRQASLNELVSPHIYYAALMAGPTFFDDPRTHASAKGAIPGDCAWMKAVDFSTNMPIAIAEAKGTGASAIKIYADLPIEVIKKITMEAHNQQLKVWSHAAVFPAKPLGIVKAGVDVVSHATLLAWEGVDYLPSSAKGRYISQEDFDIQAPIFEQLLEEMSKRGTILDATLATYQQERFDKSIFLQGVTLTKLAYQKGVKIGVGTDKGVDGFPAISPLLEEMEILVNEVGMTPLEVIQAATVTNAEMIGIADKVGSIVKGKQADLVVLDKNPLEDILHIGAVQLVVKNGRVY